MVARQTEGLTSGSTYHAPSGMIKESVDAQLTQRYCCVDDSAIGIRWRALDGTTSWRPSGIFGRNPFAVCRYADQKAPFFRVNEGGDQFQNCGLLSTFSGRRLHGGKSQSRRL